MRSSDVTLTEVKRRPVLDALRWVGFLPVAAIAAYVAYMVVSILNRISMSMMGFDPGSTLDRLFIEVVSSMAMGAAFVYAGARVAPASKEVVVFGLAVLAVAIAGFLLFPAIMSASGWAIVSGLSMAVGAGSVAWAVYTGELDGTDL